jgi:transcriptional regulator with GAF, ATPase, and Fis domain
MQAALLVDLVEAMSRAHTETTCAGAAFEVLAKTCAVAGLEITLEEAGNGSRQIVTGAVTRAGRRTDRTSMIPLVNAGGASGRAVLVLTAESPSFTPADLDLLGRVVAAALRQVDAISRVATVSRMAHAKIRQLDEHLKDAVLPKSIVAVAPATRRIFTETIPLVAKRDTGVLVLGETGTGKELVAHRIHELSHRARRPFVRVNCGAIPSELVESTLFGHEPGSFTGAARRHIGVFERAHGGTLFLDEVGELPLGAQVKLLRVLESGELERLGGDRLLRVDVRIIAATHRDLQGLVADRRFREDLYYRLNVFPIQLPPLRERPIEIAALARQILGDLARRFGVAEPALDRRALTRLRSHSWPGNVRELRNVLERSLLLQREGSFDVDLPSSPRAPAQSFEQSARQSIEAALLASGGRIYGNGGAAALLGLKPTTLASKMKRLGVASKQSPRSSSA